MRFNPLNLAKIVCFARWVKGAKCVNFLRFSKRKGVADSDLYYFKDKGSIKITSKLEALCSGWVPCFVCFSAFRGHVTLFLVAF